MDWRLQSHITRNSIITWTTNYEISRRLRSLIGGCQTTSYLVLTNVKKSNCRFFFGQFSENYRGSQRVKCYSQGSYRRRRLIVEIQRKVQLNYYHIQIYIHRQSLQVALVQQVVCWLIRQKTRVRVPGQTSKQNTKSISSTISSQQISGKNSESKLKLP